MKTVFLRALEAEDKAVAIAVVIEAIRSSRPRNDIFVLDPDSLRLVPNSPFCYWVSDRIRRLFVELPPFEGDGRTVKQGLATADDFRFVRACWEVPAERVLEAEKRPDWRKDLTGFKEWCRKRTFEGKCWVPFAKGGEYSPYYADIHLVVNWGRDGAEIGNFIDPQSGRPYSRPQNTDYYFRPGLTWPRRSYRLRTAPVPAGCVFSHAGMMAFVPPNDLYSSMGLMSSSAFDFLVRLRTGSHGGSQFEVGLIQHTPIPQLTTEQEVLATLARRAWNLNRTLDTVDETSHAFLLPTALRARLSAFDPAGIEVARIQAEIDAIAFGLYGFSEADRQAVVRGEQAVTSEETEAHDADDDGEDGEPTTADRSLPTAHLLSWCVGVAFGRFDVRLATTPGLEPPQPDPFDPLLVCPPGMLQGSDGLPARPEDVPADYPIRIDWDGILVDDPEHPDDIVRRVREVLEIIWKDSAEAIEKEACEIMGVRELRDYYRKPGNGGFWMDHVKRYSKSRRKAPIYWYLRSAKGNYGLWLYYHRLDKDILFKALLNYVEPKISLEEDRLNSLRARKEKTGSSGRETKQIEKDMDRQEQFVSELHDFADKLRRAANLHLTPDLNDGVVLNIAPLRELVPWKEAKKYWEELQEGKYDWSHIAYQLWPDRVKELCKRDRSVAIAHGFEHLYVIEAPVAKKKKGTTAGVENELLDEGE